MAIRVNGEVIPEEAVQFELDRLVKFYAQHLSPDQIKQQMDALKAKAADQVIGLKLLMTQAQEMDLRVPREYIEERLRELEKQVGGPDALDVMLEDQGRDSETLRREIERGRKVDLLIEKITADVPEPTEDEIVAHFNAHADEYARADRACAQHILVKPASEKVEDQEIARSRLVEIRQKIEDGADFSDMASAHSECPSGKDGGGLGWFSRGMMLPEFDEVVFAMDVDELSDVIQSPVGFHIIYKLGEEEGGSATLEEAREKVREFLRHARRGETISAYVNDLREKAVVQVD